MKRILFIAVCMFFSGVSLSQFVMSNGTINACAGTIGDSGGAGANYGNSENFELIICPDVAGAQVSLNFTAFGLEDGWDFLEVYNGVGTGSPSLGVYTGVAGPGLVQSNSPSGCITLVFTSDGSFNDIGFLATISCSQPCQDVISNATPLPGFSSATFIDICQGDNIQFTGNGGYPQNGTGYIQSDATSTFNWTFGDGATGVGQVTNHVYNTPGIFQVDLDITDVNGCPNINDIDVIVRVAADPIFVGTVATNPVICLGETNTLTGAVAPTSIALNCTPPVAGTIALPDGSGVSYSTAITVDCFNPGQTITAASDIDDICFDMEHSYAGDLNIAIECPDGTIVELVDYAGLNLDGEYIGEPVDNTTGDVGTPYTYCFDNVSATTWADVGAAPPTYTYTDNAGITHTNQEYIPAGSYQSAEPLAGLVGCPLNGDWSIIITDNLAADDGYIFAWSMNFNPAIVPAALEDTPAITAEGWQADPTITGTAGSVITVEPAVAGPACYTYEATDEYGCTYDTTVCFTVLPPTDPFCPSCLITNYTLNAFLGNCETVWDIDGVVEFVEFPATGDLVIEDCDGNITVIASAPFTSPVNYAITGPAATIAGGNCDIEVYFTDEITCEQTITINLPGYTPNDEAGTVTATLNGNSINDFIVCDGDDVDILEDGNSAIPPIAPGNDPGIIYFVYSCPPTPGGPGIDPLADPCFEGLVFASNVNFTNAGGSTDPLLTGFTTAAVDGTFYVVPMTLGSFSAGTYNPDCYDLAIDQMTTIQYLNPIIPVIVEDCQSGEAEVTITGGYPEYYGGNFTISNLLPATAGLSTTTVAHGGSVTITGLVDGDNYSFDITDANGCPETISGTFTGTEDPSFTYPLTAYCIDAADPSPIITGVPGGTFTSTAGISINAGTGAIDLSASTAGTYTVTYTTPDPVCFDSETFDITINPLPVVTAINNGPMCVGGNVDITGGGAVNYTWNNGLGAGITHNVSPAVTTLYTVTGTDANGCTNTATTNVVVNPLPVVNAGVDQEFCIGPNATLAGSGAVSYVWDNGVVDGVPFVPTVGTTTYTVTGTDANGCVNTDQVDVTVNPLPIISAGADDAICVGGNIDITATGGATYTWDNGLGAGATHNVSPAATTTYTVTGTDANGCVNTDQVQISILATAPINAGLDVTICEGENTTLTATGGVTYTWDNGLGAGNNFVVAPVVTTTYTVNGTDANGCTGTDQVQVTVNALPVVNAGVDQAECEGTMITLNGAGANTYVWDNGVTDGVAFAQAVGTITYTVTGTDANNCVNTDQVDVTINPLPIINAGADQTVCENVQVTLTGAGAPTLAWDNGVADGVAFNPPIGATTTYTLTGTDANGCINTDQVDVTVNPLPVIDAGADDVICIGENSTLTAVGGVSYVWDNGVGAGNGIVVSPAATTTYTVTGTDANGCVNTDQVQITVNPLPIVNAGVDQEECDGTMITLNGAGANSYVWDNGVTDGVAFAQAVGTITYTVTGTDVNGCVNTDQVDVTINPLPIINAGADQTVCENVQVTLTGAGAPTLAWDNGVADGVAFNPPVGATTTYTLTGTDANGCVNTDQVDVTVNALPVVNAGADQAECEGTMITLNGAGANSYVWDNGVTDGTAFAQAVGTVVYTITGTDANGCVNTDQVQVTINPNPTPVISGAFQYCTGTQSLLDAGPGFDTYLWSNGGVGQTELFTDADNPITVTVTFATGCSGTSPAVNVVEDNQVVTNSAFEVCQGDGMLIHGNFETVGNTYSQMFVATNGCDSISNVTLTVNPLPIVDAGIDQEECIGVNTTLTASGAVNYAWDNGVTNGITFSQPVGTVTYTVTGTDANMCVNTDQVDVIINPLPVVDAGVDFEICIGDPATLNGAGANTYAWNNGVTDGTAFNPGATNTYTVTGTDINGCVNTDDIIVTVNALPIVDAGLDQTVCDGVMTTLNGSGANTYVWDNGITDGVAFQQAVGTITYTVTGTDGNGCVNTDQADVTVNALPLVDAGLDQVECDGVMITLTGAGANSYVWDNGVTNGIAFQPAVGTLTYTVTGTDVNGCVNTDQVDVTINPLPVVDAGADFAICAGDPATLNGAGATSYVWNNGVTDGVAFNPIATNTYTVTGTDGNGCVNTDQITVTVNALPNVNAGPDQEECEGTMITLSGSGATSYVWDNGVTDGVAFIQAPGLVTYTVTGTDGNMCVNTDQVDVLINALPVVDAGLDQTVCDGVATTVSGSGATSYVWDNGVTNNVGFVQPVGILTYTVTGTDANMCVNTDQLDITVNALPIVDAGPDQTVCEGTAVTLTGNGALNYVWNNGVTDGVPFVPAVGSLDYTVTGTDVNMCSNTDIVNVTVEALPTVFAGNDLIICEGEQIILTASGAANYVWDNGVTDGVAFTPGSTQNYTVVGTTAGGCQDSDDVTITIEPTPVVDFSGDNLFGCAPLTVMFTNNTGVASDECVWTFSDGSTEIGCDFVNHTFTTPGCYDVTLDVTTVNGCSNSLTFVDYVCVDNDPIASFVASETELTNTNTEVDFTNTSIGAVNYEWTFGDGSAMSSSVDTQHTFPDDEPGSYTVELVAISVAGCTDTARQVIVVNEELIFYVPNTFTPDSDDFNESFSPVFTSGYDPFDYTLLIFNRWGELIFESHDASIGWNGKYGVDGELVKDGTYVWKIEFKTNKNDERKVVVGHVNLLR